jgi:hypothetical protein
MIDNPRKTGLLIAMLKDFPIQTIMTPSLATTMAEQSPDIPIPDRCNVADVFYTGDVGGILCQLDIGRPEGENVYFVSITHLRFERSAPLAREIEVYQRHRRKKKIETTGRAVDIEMIGRWCLF